MHCRKATMINSIVKLLVLAVSVSAVSTTGERNLSQEQPFNHTLVRPKVRSRSIQNSYKDRGSGQILSDRLRNGASGNGVGSPGDWTMSKANLVAEFFTSETAPPQQQQLQQQGHLPKQNYYVDGSQKLRFPFVGNTQNNGTYLEGNNVKVSNNGKRSGMQRPPPPRPSSDSLETLVTSGTTYNAIPNRNTNGNNGFRFPTSTNNGGYPSSFRPLFKFPPVNFFSALNSSPASGYPLHQRPPRGPPPQLQTLYGPPQMQRPINGLRPPPANPIAAPPIYLPPQGNQQQQQQKPPSQYTPQQPNQQRQPPFMPASPNNDQPQRNRNPPPPPILAPQGEYLHPNNESSNNSFTPSQEYLPQEQIMLNGNNNQHPQQQQFQPGPPPPQILDTYRNQAVYPVPPLSPPSDNKALVYVTADTTEIAPTTSQSRPPPPPFSNQPMDSFTNYENEVPSPPPQVSNPNPSLEISKQIQLPSNPPVENLQTSRPVTSQRQHQSYNRPQMPPQSLSTPNLNLNDLTLTEPLSQVLADANAKAGDATDKTIRFVIHKAEDEDIVKNAILEDAQNRYEDVRFVQGPNLKVQRKETVYLPPKRKTVVYILLKEPQIDTDVQVMTPQEDDPAPEVYITYQKSDGAVKTKHYSPKPIRQEDMKKYLDIDEDHHYGAGEESRIHPRFSKTTSVSLSTSSKTSRTTASTSSSLASTEIMDSNNYYHLDHDNNTALLANHKMFLNESSSPKTVNGKSAVIPQLKPSPLLYSTFTSSSGSISSNFNDNINNTRSRSNYNSSDPHSLIHYNRFKKGRSPSYPRRVYPQPVLPASPRRVLRTPIQCPTIK